MKKFKKNFPDYVAGGLNKVIYGLNDVIHAKCPFCGSQRRELLAKERGIIGVVRCLDCVLIYTHPRLKSPEQVYWGTAEKYFDEVRLVYAGIAKHHRHSNYLQTLKVLGRFHRSPGRKLLEVGPGMGVQLDLARKAGWEVRGLEPSPSFCRLLREKLHLQVLQGTLSQAPKSWNSSFDAVIMTDVLEHLANPVQDLRRVGTFLRKSGTLLVKVPNAGFNLLKQRLGASGAAPATQRKSAFYDLWDAYEHMVHYTHATLESMLSKAGFQILFMGLGKPCQTPAWHEKTGFYFQYPSPWHWDWKRRIGRWFGHQLGLMEYYLRGKKVGYFGSTLLAVAEKAANSDRRKGP